jgi:hypothetical protein
MQVEKHSGSAVGASDDTLHMVLDDEEVIQAYSIPSKDLLDGSTLFEALAINFLLDFGILLEQVRSLQFSSLVCEDGCPSQMQRFL